jgi:hypothetical protein
MDDMGLDPVPGQPSCQPEPVTPSFEANSDACNGATAPGCLVTPAVQHAQQVRFVRRDLLQRLALDPRDGPGNQPARLTELDDSNQRGGLFEGDEGPAQIVLLGHQTLHSALITAAMVSVPRRLPHSF